MSEIPGDLRFTEEHEWLRLEDDGSVLVGISEHAQEALGDLVFVELPEIDQVLTAGEGLAVVESVKAASDVYIPLDATVTQVNETLIDTPEKINESPYEEGWIARVAPSDSDDLNSLMDADAYQQFLDDLED